MPRRLFMLGNFRAALRADHVASTSRRPLREFLQRTLDLPDLDWPINRPGEHGVPVEDEGGGIELISTWFSGLAGYQACLEEMAATTGRRDVVDEFWRRADTRLVHFLGFDCSFSHAIGYRAILHTLEAAPRQVHYYSNAFLKLDGKDFSTSRGHAIWARDVLGRIDADVLRRYMIRVAPEEVPANFDSADFNAWVDAAQQEARAAIEQSRRIRAPAASLLGALDASGTARSLRRAWQAATHRDQFSAVALSRVIEGAFDLMHAAARRDDVPALATHLALLAAVALSVMPGFAGEITQALGLDPRTLDRWLADRDDKHAEPSSGVAQKASEPAAEAADL
jgi:methionyl-tRNA synthetase